MNDCWSKPHSQTLYAIKAASPEDSMMFVRRNTKPMKVKNKKAVTAAPRRVEDRGEAAAAGYD